MRVVMLNDMPWGATHHEGPTDAQLVLKGEKECLRRGWRPSSAAKQPGEYSPPVFVHVVKVVAL